MCCFLEQDVVVNQNPSPYQQNMLVINKQLMLKDLTFALNFSSNIKKDNWSLNKIAHAA